MLHQPDDNPFEGRGLDIEMAYRMGALFQRGRFVFEYRNRGQLLSRKIRTPDKTFWFEPSGAPLQLWNLDGIRDLPSRPAECLVITEGEFDAIAVAQACGGFVVSVPNGASGKKSEPGLRAEDDTDFRYLWGPDLRLIPEIEQFDKVVLCTDADEKGLRLRDELAIRIGEARCWFVEYPGCCKDANDVLKLHGADALRTMITDAKPLRPGYLLRYSDIPPRSLDITYSSGWEALDKHLMLRRPELMIVTGQPGHGKGQWIRSLAYHPAEAHRFKIGFLTPEDPPDRHKLDMMRFALRRTPHPTREEQADALRFVNDHFFISLPPEDEPITLGMVEQEMEAAALHHDCQVFVVDPWNEIEHQMERGESETLYIERALRAFRRKIRRLQMILIIAAHPTKLGKDGVVNLQAISGSANWRNKADHGVIVRRQSESSRIVEICIEKSKDHEKLGIPGSVWMLFNKQQTDYTVIPKPEDAASKPSLQEK